MEAGQAHLVVGEEVGGLSIRPQEGTQPDGCVPLDLLCQELALYLVESIADVNVEYSKQSAAVVFLAYTVGDDFRTAWRHHSVLLDSNVVGNGGGR